MPQQPYQGGSSVSPKRNKPKKHHLSVRLPTGFYGEEAIYWSGGMLELEHFRRVVLIESDRLCVETRRGYLTVTGQQLKVAAMETGRLLVRGQVQQIALAPFAARKEAP